MQVRIKEKEVEKKFVPFTLEITIESEDELREMWHRNNLSSPDIIGAYDKEDRFGVEFPGQWSFGYSVFSALDKKCIEIGLKK